jgi:hypothetical protein
MMNIADDDPPEPPLPMREANQPSWIQTSGGDVQHCVKEGMSLLGTIHSISNIEGHLRIIPNMQLYHLASLEQQLGIGDSRHWSSVPCTGEIWGSSGRCWTFFQLAWTQTIPWLSTYLRSMSLSLDSMTTLDLDKRK